MENLGGWCGIVLVFCTIIEAVFSNMHTSVTFKQIKGGAGVLKCHRPMDITICVILVAHIQTEADYAVRWKGRQIWSIIRKHEDVL